MKNDNLRQWVELYEEEKSREHDDEERHLKELLEKDPTKMIRPEKERLVVILRAKDFSITEIAERVQLSRPTVISIIRDHAHAIAKLSKMELQELLVLYKQTAKKKLQVFGGVLGRLLNELEGRDLTEVPVDRLLEMILKYSKALGDAIADKVVAAQGSTDRDEEEAEFNTAAVS